MVAHKRRVNRSRRSLCVSPAVEYGCRWRFLVAKCIQKYITCYSVLGIVDIFDVFFFSHSNKAYSIGCHCLSTPRIQSPTELSEIEKTAKKNKRSAVCKQKFTNFPENSIPKKDRNNESTVRILLSLPPSLGQSPTIVGILIQTLNFTLQCFRRFECWRFVFFFCSTGICICSHPCNYRQVMSTHNIILSIDVIIRMRRHIMVR